MILPRYELSFFVRVAGLTGAISNFKVERQRIFQKRNRRRRFKAGISDLLPFLGHFGHHFHKFRRAAAQSNSHAPAPHGPLLAALVGTPSCYPAALPSLVCFCLAFAKIVSEY